jgi:hypothetical protein
MEEMAVSFTALAERWASPEAELDTAEFTQSAHGMGAILSAVGGPAFGFAAVDYNKKCDSLRDAAAARPEARTLQAIVAADAASGTLRTQGSLARNLWRVLNALRFCRELFVGILPAAGAGAEQSADAEKVSLSAVAWTAYGAPRRRASARTRPCHAACLASPRRNPSWLRPDAAPFAF